jgi:hypothetical protein
MHGDAGLAEAAGDGCAKAGGAAGDDGHLGFVVVLHEVHVSLM